MQNVFYLMKEPMFIVELEHDRWSIRDLNQSFTALSGYKKNELLEADPAGLLKEGLPFGQLIARLTDEAEEAAASLEWELISKSTAAVPVRLSCRTLQSDDRTCYVIMCQDIAGQRWIEEYAVENHIDASLSVDAQFKIRSLERYFSPVKNKASHYLNASLFDFVAESSRKPLRKAFDNARTGGAVEQAEATLQIGDSAYYASALIKPLFNGSRAFKGYIVIVTSLRFHEQEEDPSLKLRMLMLNKNISATSLAQSTLISLTTISKIRNGKIKKPQRLTAELIAGRLGVKPETIWSSFKR